MKKRIYAFFFVSFGSYAVENTINYVWVPADNVTLPQLEFINGIGSRTGTVTFPGSQGTAGFNHRIFDCSVSDWSGLWNKDTYTYLVVPQTFPTQIGDIKLKTTFTNSSYQWTEDRRDISYWLTASVNNQQLGPGSCASYGDLGVMDYRFGGAQIDVTVPTLPWAGELNVNIPIYAANMEHWWNVTHGGNANWEYGYTQFKQHIDIPWYIPVKIKAYTNCKLSSYNININHGTITMREALSGVEATNNINVTCSYPSNLRMTIMNSASDESNVVPCGKGNCTLTVNNNKTTTINNVTSAIISVKSLFKTSTQMEGQFSGNAILRIDVI
ncbi:PixG protein [Escherichia coli]|uniref:hypothetical protein n=1 Tax=Escherichia coli TaxID=562 RepID=UPI00191A79A1|nr:hypothetical protein [Escherichia coli]CAD6177190.1 PixG protein [Escherichia coli]